MRIRARIDEADPDPVSLVHVFLLKKRYLGALVEAGILEVDPTGRVSQDDRYQRRRHDYCGDEHDRGQIEPEGFHVAPLSASSSRDASMSAATWIGPTRANWMTDQMPTSTAISTHTPRPGIRKSDSGPSS